MTAAASAHAAFLSACIDQLEQAQVSVSHDGQCLSGADQLGLGLPHHSNNHPCQQQLHLAVLIPFCTLAVQQIIHVGAVLLQLLPRSSSLAGYHLELLLAGGRCMSSAYQLWASSERSACSHGACWVVSALNCSITTVSWVCRYHFYVPAQRQQWHWAFHSCNGLSAGSDIDR